MVRNAKGQRFTSCWTSELALSVFPLSVPGSSQLDVLQFSSSQRFVIVVSPLTRVRVNDSDEAVEIRFFRRVGDTLTGAFRPAKSSTGSRCLQSDKAFSKAANKRSKPPLVLCTLSRIPLNFSPGLLTYLARQTISRRPCTPYFCRSRQSRLSLSRLHLSPSTALFKLARIQHHLSSRSRMEPFQVVTNPRSLKTSS